MPPLHRTRATAIPFVLRGARASALSVKRDQSTLSEGKRLPQGPAMGGAPCPHTHSQRGRGRGEGAARAQPRNLHSMGHCPTPPACLSLEQVSRAGQGQVTLSLSEGPRVPLGDQIYLWCGEVDPPHGDRMRPAGDPRGRAQNRGPGQGWSGKTRSTRWRPHPLAMGWSSPSRPGLVHLIRA